MKIEKRTFTNLYEAFLAMGGKPEPAKPAPVAAREKRQALNAKRNARKHRAKKSQIAVLDFETDPFDNVEQGIINPFVCEIYAPELDRIVIWDDDKDSFLVKVLAAIEALPGKYTIFAHNGGKFDFMFFVHKLRGRVMFKGRGIMTCQVGNHQLRDSYHIIPERLANLKKQEFDYKNLVKSKRHKHREEILDYLHSDCENLYFYVKRFVERFGFKISIGAAALAKIREHYEIEHVTETTDAYLRQYFFGGRVECLTGRQHIARPMKLYDINSAYPDQMANTAHPVGSEYVKRSGEPNSKTAFIRLTCQNRGALMSRGDDGSVGTGKRTGEFFTTIHEYKMALELGLISDVKIIECVDNFKWTAFDKFVVPIYARRADNKKLLDTFVKGTVEYDECNVEVVFDKLVMNNGYGKTAQDSRKFKEHYITDPAARPDREAGDFNPHEWELEFQGEGHWIWSRPSAEQRFLNVGTGASITGAVRAKLMLAIHNAVNPVYCDTDSIICEELHNTDLDKYRLGAWDLEKSIEELYICGKKQYAYRTTKGEEFVKNKGAVGVTFADMAKLFADDKLVFVNFGPTLTRHGKQTYISREIRATAQRHA